MSDKDKRRMEMYARHIAEAQTDLLEARKHGNADDIEYAEWRLHKAQRMEKKMRKLKESIAHMDTTINKLNAKYGR